MLKKLIKFYFKYMKRAILNKYLYRDYDKIFVTQNTESTQTNILENFQNSVLCNKAIKAEKKYSKVNCSSPIPYEQIKDDKKKIKE